ncbi:hypothetical protein ACG2K1_07250 [Neisseria sp. 23W00296]
MMKKASAALACLFSFTAQADIPQTADTCCFPVGAAGKIGKA